MIFDLDPGEDLGFDAVVRAARDLRDRLSALDLESFVKTTGGKGLHVVVPIEPIHEWRLVKAWAKAFSEAMATDAPDLYLTRIAKAERTGRIFIDYLRNDPTSTAVGPYSTRARPGAPVAMPLDWNSVKMGLDPGRFTVATSAGYVASRADPWADMDAVRQRLPDLPGA
jgi:bifunctional non-homologous end joining protein LigD